MYDCDYKPFCSPNCILLVSMSFHIHNNKEADAKTRFWVKMTSNNNIFLYGDEKEVYFHMLYSWILFFVK